MFIPADPLAQMLYQIATDVNAHVDGIVLISHDHTETGIVPIFNTVSHLSRDKINAYLTEYVAGEFADQLEGK